MYKAGVKCNRKEVDQNLRVRFQSTSNQLHLRLILFLRYLPSIAHITSNVKGSLQYIVKKEKTAGREPGRS